jgi:phosphatidylserine synthase 2
MKTTQEEEQAEILVVKKTKIIEKAVNNEENICKCVGI